ncbi:hypothetical protein LJC60_00830 [Ruminococcaceae bacterium OttesenSCG-928-D13]|nr:hypothetical protein [Ruminococcaceae bacterium OttesenSCG-928-D13]
MSSAEGETDAGAADLPSADETNSDAEITRHLYAGDTLPDLGAAEWAETGAVILELHANLYTGDGDEAPLSFVVPEGKTVTLRSSPDELGRFNITSGAHGPEPLVINRGTLLIEAVELNGLYVSEGSPVVQNNGNLSLFTYSGIINGSGYAVENNGSMTMHDGYIRQNAGGGVHSTGTLVLAGGSIDGNLGRQGAGVLVAAGSFEMTGGAIRGNTAAESGGGVAITGGSFTMAGGVITGNSAGTVGGGVSYEGGSLSLAATVSGNGFEENATPGNGTDLYISATAPAPVELKELVLIGPAGGLYSEQPLEAVLAIADEGLKTGSQVEVEGCPEGSATLSARVASKLAGDLTADEAVSFAMPSTQLSGVPEASRSFVVWQSALAQTPALVAALPTYAANGLADVSGTLTLTFNREMDTASAGKVTLNGVPLSGGAWLDSQHYALPYLFLADNSVYAIHVSGFKSLDGLTMDANGAFSFTTADKTAPFVVSASPSGRYAPTGGTLRVLFNEPVEDTGRLALYDEATGQALPLTDLQWADSKTLTACYTGLAPNTQHRLVVSGYRDLSGNTMFETPFLFTTMRPLVTSITIDGYEDGVLRFIPGGARILPITVTGEGGFAPHNPAVLWTSSNSRVARVETQPDGTTLFHAGIAGSAVLTASSADGGCTARFTMVVAPFAATLSLSTHTVLLGANDTAEIGLTATGLEPLERHAWLELYDATTLLPWTYDAVSESFTGAPVNCVLRDGAVHVTLSEPAGTAVPRAVVVRVVAMVPGFPDTRVSDECVIHLPQHTGQGAWQVFHLTSTSLTAYALKPEAARLSLRREYAADAAPLPLKGCTVRFAEANADLNQLFAFEVVDDETVAVRVIATDIRMLKSSYKGRLEIVSKNGVAVPVKQPLTLKVSKKLPTVKAIPVKLNSFYSDAEAILPAAAGWDSLVENPAYKAKNDALLRGPKAWLRTSTDESGNLLGLSPTDTKKHSGTLYLLASPSGWGGRQVPVSVKVSTARTPPAVRLKSTKASLYAESQFSTGALLTLKPKGKNTTLAALGAVSVSVVPPAEVPAGQKSRYPNQALYTTSGFDPHSGTFTLTTVEGATPVRGAVLLQVRLDNAETGPVHLLPVTVSVVPKGTKLSLKAGKQKVTLNPAAAEAARLPISTSIPGFDLAAFGGLSCELLNPKGLVAPTARIEGGNTLVLETPLNAARGESYKVKLTLPGAGTGQKSDPDATLTLTVRTAAEQDKPSASLNVSGKASLTSSRAVTVTVKLANYGGRLGADPVFEFTTLTTQSPVDPANFSVVNLAENKWAIRPVQGTALLPGSYRLRLAGWTSESGEVFGPSDWSVFEVIAPKNAVIQSVKTVKLYAAEPGSRATVAFDLPEGCPAVDTIKARDNAGVFRVDAWPGGCVIRFANEQLHGAIKASTLTIDLYAGNLLLGTARVKVTVQNI